jgi:hypothetical protein
MDVATEKLIELEQVIIPKLKAQGYNVQAAQPTVAMGQGGGGGYSGSNASPSGGSSPQLPQVDPSLITVGGVTGYPIGRPNAPLPLTQDPASFLASLISVQRNSGLPYEIRVQAQDMLESIATRAENIRNSEPDEDVPEHHMLAPFVPNRAYVRDMVMSTNGKNRGHL